MSTRNEITVIIPTLTNEKGLISLLSFLKKNSYHTIVIDNSPTESKKKAAAATRSLYLPQTVNLGFSRAVNLSVSHARTKWILILNDDIQFVSGETIGNLLKFANKYSFDAASPVLKDMRGNVENTGYRVLPIGRVALLMDLSGSHDQNMIDGLTAACLLIKKDVFESVHGFDPRFFAYLEDVDLFLRLKKTGSQFAVDLAEEVIHSQGSTSRKMGNLKEMQDFKNWIRIIFKHWGIKKLMMHLPGITCERLRNLSGYAKASFQSKKNKVQ